MILDMTDYPMECRPLNTKVQKFTNTFRQIASEISSYDLCQFKDKWTKWKKTHQLPFDHAFPTNPPAHFGIFLRADPSFRKTVSGS